MRRLSFILGTIGPAEARQALARLARPGAGQTGGGGAARLEAGLSARLGGAPVFGFGAGRMALYALLKAAGVGPGHEVILPGYTCVVVPCAVVATGARPVYVDVNPRTWVTEVSAVAAALTPATRAVVAQHLFGGHCDVAGIKELAGESGVRVLEDCAQSLGATHQGRPVGSSGDGAFFSFEQSKVVTAWTGGAAAAANPALADKLARLAAGTPPPPAGRARAQLAHLLLFWLLGNPAVYGMGRWPLAALSRLGWLRSNITAAEMAGGVEQPYPMRLSDAQAGLVAGQLERLPDLARHRRRIHDIYVQTLAELGQEPFGAPGYEPAHLRTPLLVRDRPAFARAFAARGVDLGQWFNAPLHPRGSDAAGLGYRPGSCPQAEFLAEHVVNLPTHPWIRVNDAERICSLLRRRRDQVLSSSEIGAAAVGSA